MIDSVFAGRSAAGSATASDTGWHAESLPTVRRRLGEPDGDFAAFVVDHPERPGGLAAPAVGTLDHRIGRAGNPHGLTGSVFSVAGLRPQARPLDAAQPVSRLGSGACRASR